MASRLGRCMAVAAMTGAAFVALSALAGAGPEEGALYGALLKGDRTGDESVFFKVSSNGKKVTGLGGVFAEAGPAGCDRDQDRGRTFADNNKAPIKDNRFKKKLDLFPIAKAGRVGTVKIAAKFKRNGDAKGTVKVRYSNPDACDYDDRFLADAS